MKKYIFIALAAAGTMACSKLTPVDSIPVTELPEDETTETVPPKEGETITIQLAQTKVTLNETVYVFEGNEQIVVKAASGPVATLSNSTKDPNIFTGVFEKPLGKESDIFDFYYNCTDASGKASYVQNGQPWLEHKGVTATRAKDGGYAYVVEGVQLRQPKDYVALAITSAYDCTVDFHTLTTALPTGETTISGIQLGSGSKKPYFVNITNGMKGGFYLTVTNTDGQKMYTSYGTGTTDGISSNQLIKTKTFEAFSITGQLVDDTKTTFKSTYDVYQNSGAGDANKINSDIISSGEATFTMTGISKTIRNLVSLKNITVTFSDDVSASVGTTTPAWTETKAWTIAIPETTGHNKWGPVTVKNAVAVFSTPDGNDYEVSFANPSITRYITGLPAVYTKQKDYKNNGWNCKASDNSKNTYSLHNGDKLTSPAYYFPKSTNIVAKLTISPSSSGTSGSMVCGGTSQDFSGNTSSLEFNLSLEGYNSLEISVTNKGTLAYLRFTQLNQTTIHYRNK